MPNQFNQPINPSEAKPSFQPQLPKRPSLPAWASILIIVLAAVIVLSLVSWAGYRAFYRLPFGCTEDAKICPDGTTVGRVGLRCEFAPCPSEQTPPDETANWQVYQNEEYGFEVKIPSNFDIRFTEQGPTGFFKIREWENDKFKQHILEIMVQPWQGESLDELAGNSLGPNKKITLGGQIAWLSNDPLQSTTELKDASRFMISVFRNSLAYIITYPKSNNDIVDQILSTFKFTK